MVKAACDLCDNAEGSVYCFDESAVMCRECDYRSESARKVSGTAGTGATKDQTAAVCSGQSSQARMILVRGYTEYTARTKWPGRMSV